MQYFEELSTTSKTVILSLAASVAFYALRKCTAGGVNKHRIDMSDKVVLITGGNTGIGKETAKELATLGAEVIITVRDEQKEKSTVGELQKKTRSAKVSYIVLELERLRSVRECAERLRSSGKKIDILILNAGVALVPYNLTEDGFETHTAVNYLSQFLLTQLLFKHNLINEPGRILVVSSLANESATIDFDDLNWKKRAYSLVGAYAQSKLANVLFAKELDERLRRQNRDITAVSIHPGPVATDLGRNIPWLIRPINALFIPFLYKTVWEGAQTTLHCAMAPEIPSQGGRYFADCKPKEPNKLVYDSTVRARLWHLSEKLVGLNAEKSL